MQRRCFQVKLSAILWAIFWLGLCLASCAIDYRGELQIRLLIVAARIFSPFVAIGALFDRSWTDLAAGVALAAAYMAVWSAAILDGLTSLP